jgi:polyhydroxybutyrate depolymerase
MELMTNTLTVGGLERRYLLHAPVSGHEPKPALLALHGAGGSAAWMRDETRLNSAADRHGFLVAYPDGLAIDPSRPAGFLDNPQVWNAGAGPGLIVNRGPDDVAFLAAVIANLNKRAPVDPNRIYVTGFSNGAAMTFRFAAERSHLMAAIAPVAGYCPHVSRMDRRVPTLFIVGTDDPLVPVNGGAIRSPWDGRVETRPPLAESLARWATALGIDGVPIHTSENSGVRTDEYSPEFTAMTISGLGHHWPGGRGRLLRRLAGKPSNRVDANETIWDFLRRQSADYSSPEF